MKPNNEFPIGVLVGRFQVHKLHSAHIDLIEHVISRHKKVILFLGVSPVTPSKRNPLDFKSREIMIHRFFPQITILPISDEPTDTGWSHTLDSLIQVAEPHGKVMLYGSRDSFINHYHGAHPVTELESKTFVSGTEVRKNISDRWFESADFRAGVIYGTTNRHAHVYPTVDIAIVKDKGTQVLLAKKPAEQLWRFVGGFADPEDESLMEAAQREVAEETGLEVGNFRYVASIRVDDWRYREEADKIMTTFFAADYVYGAPKPQDDISELAWFDVNKFNYTQLEPVHRPLWKELAAFLMTSERTMENEKEHSAANGQLQADPLADVPTEHAVRNELS